MNALFYSINNSDKKFVFEYYKLRDDSSDSYSLHELREESKSPKVYIKVTKLYRKKKKLNRFNAFTN